MADQYVVEVTNDRGRPRFTFLNNSGSSIDTSGMSQLAAGNTISYQGTEPNGIGTFTISLIEP